MYLHLALGSVLDSSDPEEHMTNVESPLYRNPDHKSRTFMQAMRPNVGLDGAGLMGETV